MKFIMAMAATAGFAIRILAQEPSLTIYNADFAVVRDTVPLALKAGVNEEIYFSGMTAMAETDSVILRDPAGKMKLQVLQQSYRNNPVSQDLLLALNEGKTIDFLVREPGKEDHTVRGTIIRGGYLPALQQTVQPIIEVNGKKQFTLPGVPLFPDLPDETILKPTISWKLKSDVAGNCDAQIAYLTGGLSWEAFYNVVGSGSDDTVDLVGWVTFDNESGRTFRNARIKFLAGEVKKLPPWEPPENPFIVKQDEERESPPPVAELLPVNEKAFADFHLYTVNQPVTLRDGETKQVEFVRAHGVKTHTIYVYDGATENYGDPAQQSGTDNDDAAVNSNVWVLREFKNSQDNNLGVPLPGGDILFYQQDSDKQMELTGFIPEGNTSIRACAIDHTPRDEMIRVYASNSLDLAGERHRTDLKIGENNQWVEMAYEIKLRNHKQTPVEIRTVEHLMPAANWEVTEKSDDFTKTDSDTIEFRSTLQPNEEKVITYRVHYSH